MVEFHCGFLEICLSQCLLGSRTIVQSCANSDWPVIKGCLRNEGLLNSLLIVFIVILSRSGTLKPLQLLETGYFPPISETWYFPFWILLQCTKLAKYSSYIEWQECIPVGCVPPAHWPYLVVSYAPPRNHAGPPATTHAHWQPCMPPQQPHTPPPSNHACRLGQHACLPPWQPRTPPPWTEWQTGVKILPCPKLRLRAENMIKHPTLFT